MRPSDPSILAKMLAFDGLTATFGLTTGPCQKDVGLVSDDFAGRTMENHAQVLTSITSIMVRTSDFSDVRVGDVGAVVPSSGDGSLYSVRDRVTVNDGALLRFYLQQATATIDVESGSEENHGIGIKISTIPLVAIVMDENENPVVGVPVTFTEPGFTFEFPTALTDADGKASSGDYSSVDFGTFTVEATSPAVNGAAEFIVDFVASAGPGGGGGAP